jgi:ATP-dependent DNA helicase DinG
MYAQLGALAPRLGSVVSTASLLLEHGEQPLAKWLQIESAHGYLTATAHACPIVPGDLLRQFLWSQVRGAIVTSASLTSCGSFDYFLREAGLVNNPAVQALEVASPFDYATQGSLTVVHTRADPKQAEAYTAEMVRLLMADIEQVQRGALVLFTSRAQMRVRHRGPARPFDGYGAGAGHAVAHAAAGSPCDTGRVGHALGVIWPAVVWRRAGFAR